MSTYNTINIQWVADTLHIPVKDVLLQSEHQKTFSRLYTITVLKKKYVLKQNPMSFVHEGKLLQYLNTITHDNNLPYCLSSDVGSNAFIMKYINNDSRAKNELNVYSNLNILSAYINIQANADINILSTFQCRHFETEDLYITIRDSFRDMLPHLNSVNSIKLETIVKSIYHLKPIFERLCLAGIPDTLEHADFHLGNILEYHSQPIFIDFAESAIACPFFSFLSFRDSLIKRYNLNLDDINLEKITNTYINLMSVLLDIPSLRVASSLADAAIVYPFYYLLTMSDVLRIHHISTSEFYKSNRLSRTIDYLFKKYT